MSETLGDLKVKIGADSSGLNKGLKGAKTAVKGVGIAIGAVIAGAGALGTAIIKASDDSKQAMNGFQSQTGATTEQMLEYRKVMDNIKANNFGESFQDVADSMALVSQQVNDLDPSQLEKITKNAIMMRDTFDMDINESIRGANALINQFGLDGDAAFNLIAQGAQNGLDQNKDLADQLSEYAPLWADLGFGAEEMMNSLVNGAEEGAYQIDFLNDAMKEFGIRTKDDSKLTREAFEAMGFDADAMGSRFAAGGEVARAAFDEVNKALFEIQDPMKQNELGVALWGIKFEDMGADAVEALTSVNGVIDETADALEKINEVKYDSIGDNISMLKNQFSVLLSGGEIDPNAMGETIKNIIDQAAGIITNVLPTVASAVVEVIPNIISSASQTLIALLPSLINTVVAMIPELIKILKEQTPLLLKAGIDILVSLIQGIAEAAPDIAIMAVELVDVLIKTIVENLPLILDAGIEILMGLIMGIIEALPSLIQTIMDLVPVLIKTLLDFIPDLAQAGVELIVALVKNLPEIIWSILEALPEIMAAIFEGFGDYFGEMGEVGLNLIKGLWEGIKNAAAWIKEKIGGFISGILDVFKLDLEINSASGKTAYFGKMTGEGFVEGMLSKVSALKQAGDTMMNAIEGSGVTGNGSQTDNSKSTIMNLTYQAATSDNDQINMTDMMNRQRRAYT